jgi:transcriptional regulator with XRE-family HTH domain
MSRWKPLPAELDPRVRQLVVRLRRLKDHSGLSLRQLAARTGYSAKSWERYLGGRSLPPREAVEAMARVSGDEPTRLLALHEVAATAWGNKRERASTPDTPAPHGSGEATSPDPTAPPAAVTAEPGLPAARTEDDTDTARAPGRSLRIALVAGAVALVLALSSGVLLAVRLMDGDGAGGLEVRTAADPLVSPPASAAASAPSSAPQSPPAYTCRVERIDGRWYAGNSRTQDAIVADGHAGPDVAEAQCLLRRAGYSPGGIDGIFGPLTERAVEQAQRRAGLVVDGIVGPHTWKALRGRG